MTAKREEPASVAAEAASERSKRELLEELRASWDSNASTEHRPLTGSAAGGADVASVVFEDFLNRQHRSTLDSIVEPAPAPHDDSLADLFRHHGVLRSVGGGSAVSEPRLALPGVGDALFGFRLRQELGRGAFARVFLAGQEDLAGRAVVLKVSGIDGNEPQVLAQLQHTNIVPIYSVHEDAAAGLRAVCMPYFGGATLSQVLRACWSGVDQPRTAQQLVDGLRAVQSPWPAPGAPASPAASRTPLEGLAKRGYVEAAAWIIHQLAVALHHAHQRGILHRDIKPSNILIGAEGEPMLLDFNLSQSQVDDQMQAHATLGGTIAYMAPEHLRALATRTPALARQVNERADVYSLGMVLYEMLAGRMPFDTSGTYLLLPPQLEAMAVERSRDLPSPRRTRSDVPWGLESIVRKCLMPEQAERYQTAGQLAEDLHAFLHDQPLRHAPELSRSERLQKWARRHPRLTASTPVSVVAALLLCGTGTALIGVQSHLISSQARQRHHEFAAGAQEALCLVNTVSDLNEEHLARGRVACEKALGLYRVLDEEKWQRSPFWQRLSAEERRSAGEDMRELLVLLAWSRTRLLPDEATTLRQALDLLARADAIDGLPPSRALWEDRAAYHQRLGESDEAAAAREYAAAIPAGSARDHYLLASARIRAARPAELAGAHAAAIEDLNSALELNPRHYWSHFQRGLCFQELGEHVLAAGDFAACTGLWPEFAWAHFNLGHVLGKAGKHREAIEAYSAALLHDGAFVEAYLNRGLARLELRQHADALADFDAARQRGLGQAFVHAGRGAALEGLGRSGDADEAFAAAFAQGIAPHSVAGQRLRWFYGFAVARRLPDQALKAFDEVLRIEPEQPQALYGRAMLVVEHQGRLEEAIGLFDRALEAQPGFEEARRFRAVLLARRGQLEAAQQDINLCLERQGRAGPTLYAATCVASLIADRTTGPAAQEARRQAMALLQQALAAGYGYDRAADDPDLAGLRQQPDFARLVAPRTQR